MKQYILKRILSIPIILFVLSVVIFSQVLFLSPSERLAVFIPSPEAFQNISLDELIIRYGLDEPIHMQYLNWLKQVLKGELGWSYSARMPVAQALALRIPATIELLLLGQVFIFFGGFFLGTYAAVKHNRFTDYVIRFFTVLGISFPGFVLALVLLIIFYVKLDIFPPGRLSLFAQDIVSSPEFNKYTGMYLIDSLLNRRLDVFTDALRHIILPSIAYSVGTLAAAVRLMRSSLLENMRKDYVNTARAKGLAENIVINKHIRRNAMLPFITFMGMEIPAMLGGAVIIETVFNYPGMGTFIVTAAHGLDFPAILGASLAIGFIIIIGNLIVDLLYRVLNPLINLE